MVSNTPNIWLKNYEEVFSGPQEASEAQFSISSSVTQQIEAQSIVLVGTRLKARLMYAAEEPKPNSAHQKRSHAPKEKISLASLPYNPPLFVAISAICVLVHAIRGQKRPHTSSQARKGRTQFVATRPTFLLPPPAPSQRILFKRINPSSISYSTFGYMEYSSSSLLRSAISARPNRWRFIARVRHRALFISVICGINVLFYHLRLQIEV